MKTWKKVVVSILGLVALAGCGQSKTDTHKVKLGVVGDDTRVFDSLKDSLDKEGIQLEYVKFTDYNQPNQALAQGEIDLNAFQHQVFLDKYNEQIKTDLDSIGHTVVATLGIYSNKYKDIKDIPDNATVAIPNDVTNGGRALILLESAGFIEVDDKAGITPTINDITAYHKPLKIKEMNASQTARSLEDTDIAVINSGYAVDSGLNPTSDALFLEPVDERSKPYVNIIVAKKEDKDNPIFAKIVTAYQQESTKKVIEETSKGASIAAWEQFGRK